MGRHQSSRAFALPTVLIASVVLLAVLAVSVTATAAVRTALKNQYYVQLAQVAGEAGVAMAKACLAASGNVPQWSDEKPLTPATDCSGNNVLKSEMKYLIVGGGGSGGGSTGGGGGAGGVIYSEGSPVVAGSYPIVVGAGGAIPGTGARGLSGKDSSFSGKIAFGGGGGGYSSSATDSASGISGGSGGGGQNYSTASRGPGAGFSGQGSNGGPVGAVVGASGGGGAGGVGTTSPATNIGGKGGNGVQYNISGSMVYYGAGGGGANGGVAGTGGNQTPGPEGGQAPSASPSTGNGGTGGWNYASGNGGAGGSGIVIISYPTSTGITATGGSKVTSGNTIIHKFTSSGTFAVTSVGTTLCPTDPRCSVTVNDNVRSSFKVPKPAVDSDNRAVTIANTGYVEVTRTSSGTVWRTYNQPSVQNAVVPDLCSGNATSIRGWSSVVKAANQDTIPAASSAQTIAIASGNVYGGTMYFRKDFSVTEQGNYDLNVYTSAAKDVARAYVDGAMIAKAAGSNATGAIALTPGCHVVAVALTNQSQEPSVSDFTLAVTRSGVAVPTVISDTSWRVAAGDAAHFSSSNYDESNTWEQVVNVGTWNSPTPWTAALAQWQNYSGDALTQAIVPQAGAAGDNRPVGTIYLRDPLPFTTTALATVRLSTMCDDVCRVYLDGQEVHYSGSGAGITTKTINIQPGTHVFGIRLYNAGSAASPSGLVFSAVDLTTNTVIARSGPNWNATSAWLSTFPDMYSYDASFVPSPIVQKTVNAKLLVVGGGGGGGSDMGGGGGGGGVVINNAYPLLQDTYTVTVGGGGVGGPAGLGQVRGTNGGNSSFDTIRALGGGGGASEYGNNNSPPGSGATAGGSAGGSQTLRASGVISMGFDSAISPGNFWPTGGGGAGGPGSTNPATGGVGVQSNIIGANYYWGGGGGGSGYTSNGGNGGAGGGGGGAVGTTTGGSGASTGSPGGGGTTVSQTNKPGGNAGANTGGGGGGGSHYNSNNKGGNGANGVVVISFPTGTLTVALTGTYTNKSSSTPGFTTYYFTGSGTFRVVSINN